MAGLAIVVLLLTGWRKTARAQPKAPRESRLPRRKWAPIGVAETTAPPLQAAQHLPPDLGGRRQFGPGDRDRGGARHRHRVRPRLDRHHADRPAQAVTASTTPARRRRRRPPGRCRHGSSVGLDATTRPCGRRRSAPWSASASSTTTCSRGRSPTPTAPCGGAPPRWPRTIPTSTCVGPLHDDDPTVVEVAAWACGEHESNRDAVLDRLIELAGAADDALVREAAVAALGAIGDERGLAAILAATADKPAVRRRAVLALAPFDGRPDVERRAGPRPRGPRLAGPPGRRGPRARVCRPTSPTLIRTCSGTVGLAGLEADALVEAVGCLARGPARQAHVLGAAPAGLVDRRPVQRLADALAAAASSTTTSSIHALRPVGMR